MLCYSPILNNLKILKFLKYIYFPPSPKFGSRIRKQNNWSYGKKCHAIISLDCFQSFLIMISGKKLKRKTATFDVLTNICVAKRQRVMKICPIHVDVCLFLHNYRGFLLNWGWYKGPSMHKIKVKKLLRKFI